MKKVLLAVTALLAVTGTTVAQNIAPSAAAQEAAASSLPTDAGVYVRAAAGGWDEIDPEVVNWKTGGVLKSTFTNGIVKGDINGHIKGGTSKTTIGSNEILVVAPEGTSITEYQLLRLREHSDSREFRVATGGVFHQSGGSNRDVLEFEHKKIARRTFLITLPSSVTDGQYGLLPPGAVASKSATSLGKVYSFRITG